jgi:hypothetical protein
MRNPLIPAPFRRPEPELVWQFPLKGKLTFASARCLLFGGNLMPAPNPLANATFATASPLRRKSDASARAASSTRAAPMKGFIAACMRWPTGSKPRPCSRGNTGQGAYTELRERFRAASPNVKRTRNRAGVHQRFAVAVLSPPLRQQFLEQFPLRVRVRLRETFFEQGQVLPVNELFHSGPPDHAKILLLGAGSACNPPAESHRLHWVFRASNRLDEVHRIWASPAPGKLKHAELMIRMHICCGQLESA